MKRSTCNFCRRSFRNTQAVRAHLKACPAYGWLPKATLPRVGNKPRTVAAPDKAPDVHSGREDVPRPTALIVTGTGPKVNFSGAGAVDDPVGQGPGDWLMVVAGPHNPVRD